MDLFTVDTVGEQNLLEQDEYNNSETLYSNTKHLDIKNAIEHEEKGDESEEEKYADKENDDNEDIEEEYDYGG